MLSVIIVTVFFISVAFGAVIKLMTALLDIVHLCDETTVASKNADTNNIASENGCCWHL